MSRWIDADALEYDTEWSEYHDGYTSYSQMEIDTAPSIDIVRCKECVRYDEHFVLSCRHHISKVHADDFCSYGKRK